LLILTILGSEDSTSILTVSCGSFSRKGQISLIVKQAEVDRVTDLINHRPRKALDYRTPSEVFFKQSGTGALQT